MIKKRIMISLCMVLTTTFVLLNDQNNHLENTEIQVNCGISNPINIVHLSDLHGKQFGPDNQKLLANIQRFSPDVIMITGDLIDRNKKNLDQTILFTGMLTKLCPVYDIVGNHEPNTQMMNKIKTRISQQGVTVLSNQIVTTNIKGNTVNILGLEKDNNEATLKNTCPPLLKELEKKEGLKIVLSHFPQNFALIDPYSFQKYNFDLMLSGHAHGGQFILPFIGGMFAPDQGVDPKYYAGLYGEHPQMVVSRGLGNSSSFPFRINNRPEIIQITVR